MTLIIEKLIYKKGKRPRSDSIDFKDVARVNIGFHPFEQSRTAEGVWYNMDNIRMVVDEILWPQVPGLNLDTVKQIEDRVWRKRDKYEQLSVKGLERHLAYYKEQQANIRCDLNPAAKQVSEFLFPIPKTKSEIEYVKTWFSREPFSHLTRKTLVEFIKLHNRFYSAQIHIRVIRRALDNWEPPIGEEPQPTDNVAEQRSSIVQKKRRLCKKPIYNILYDIHNVIVRKDVKPRRACEMFLEKNEIDGKPDYPWQRLLNYYYSEYPKGKKRTKERKQKIT